MIISLRGLTKHFGPLRVLENIDLDIQEGEILAILGTSGCGKSTLLNIISGLARQDKGGVTIAGKASDEYDEWRRIAYMFQEDRLLPWRNIRDNVAFGLENSALSRDARHAKVQKALELVELEAFASYWPHQLSGGMRSRAALARSLVVEPSVLLMDEPFSKLDAQTRSQMHTELLRLHKLTGMTIVFVTHDVEEAAVLADRIVVFSPRPGKIREVVTLNDTRPRLLTDYRMTENVRILRGLL